MRLTHISEAVPMRVILVFLIALFAVASGPARADNPYAVAGISNPAQVTQFVAWLKQAVAADDRAAIAGMVNYPLRVNSATATGRPTFYRNAAALSANYARVFTPISRRLSLPPSRTICSPATWAS
jgi:hypothetical protein